MGWLLDSIMLAENDDHYEDLCRRESRFWRWAMPILISSTILVVGLAFVAALLWKTGLF
jgi:hypothetical protein